MTLPAVRTLSEDDDTHVIEGLLSFSGPFDGRDSYGTYFSARTDWALDMHPEGVPVLFNHGFDKDFGLHPIGKTTPTASFRFDTDGLWVQMQLDKREKYYATRVRPLLDKNGLGVSQGSASHSVREDKRSHEILAWPLHEVSLTPTESNPYNIVATRSAENIHILEELADPVVATSTAQRSITTGRFTKHIEPNAEIVAPAIDATRSEPAIRTAIDMLSALLTTETPEPDPEEPEEGPLRDAYRAGARNSSKDQTRLDAIHEHAAQILGHASALGGKTDPFSAPAKRSEDDDAPPPADPVPVLIITEPEVTLEAIRAEILAAARKTGAETFRSMTG